MDLEKRLRSRGYRVTPQREAVYRVLREQAGRLLSPEEVHGQACGICAGLGLATVYRTLELFRELGVVNRVQLQGNCCFYELSSGKHHHHLVCLSCGAVDVFEDCLIEELKEMVRDGSDFLVTDHSMSLFGYCPRCLGAGGGGEEPEREAQVNRK